MNRFLGRAARRFYLRHPWQLGLALAGISLGVAVYVGVDLANDSAQRAFELSAELVRGRTTHRLLPVGDGLADTTFVDLVTQGRVERAAPIVEQPVRVAGPDGRRYTLLGVDPLEEVGFRSYSDFAPGSASGGAVLIAEPGTVLIPQSLADARGLTPGASLDLWTGDGRHPVEVAGIVGDAATGADTPPPIVTDIGTAQTIAGRPGVLTRIDLELDAAQARQLRADPPRGTVLVDAAESANALTQMTRAFRVNLTALGLLALVVGMFLIYATISFAVVQRRPVIGMLRAIGVARREVLAGVLLEAAGIGLAGTVIGLALGTLLARGLVGMVLQTLGSFYFAAEVRAVAPSPLIYAQAAALGLGATGVAALGPALDASRCSPDMALRRAALERTARKRSRLAAVAAAPVAALAAALLLGLPGLLAAFAGLFGVLCAGALLTPAATAGLMRCLEPLAERGFGLSTLLAVRGVRASLSRTGVATAALAVAVATVIGIGLMIGSFRVSLIDWLDKTLTADVYVSLDDAGGPPPDDALLAAIKGLPGVVGIGLTRFARVPTKYGTLRLRALQPGPDGWGLDIVGPEPSRALAKLASGDHVAVSEALAYRAGLAVGDTIELPTADGPRPFTICGIFRDYNTNGGSLAISLARYRRDWNDSGVSGIGVHVARGADKDAAAASVRSLLGGRRADVRSTDAIERLSLQIFDRTFKITEVLRILAGLVAFFGVLSAVLAIELERGRELAILRALGFGPGQLARLSLVQTALLGVAAALIAVPLGTVLAALLVYVINRRSFGWTMDLVATPAPILLGVALAVSAALLAGVYPAVQNAMRRWNGALREE
jgi:putative ABC transport system permease protein